MTVAFAVSNGHVSTSRKTRSRSRRLYLFDHTVDRLSARPTTMPPRKQPASTTDTSAATSTTTTRTTRARVTRTTTTEELASGLQAKLTISDPKGKQKVAEIGAQRSAPSRTATRRTQVVKKETSPDIASLSKDLSHGLTLGSRSSGKTREEQCADAMREVNTASRSLTSLVESGWKASTSQATPVQRSSSSKAQDQGSVAKQQAYSARQFLEVLRELRSGDLDVERAASSLIGKLIALDMVRITFLPRHPSDSLIYTLV